jgi:NADPH:quinone reductase
MSTNLPQMMRAVVLAAYRENVMEAIDSLCIAERPVPELRHGQVLVRVEAAPCNPSDLLLLQGKYGSLKKLPSVPGWEGAGRVVAGGGGLIARWLQGKRVACALRDDRDGTWAEYFVAEARDCIPLKRNVSFDEGASLIINPFTAAGLLATARKGNHRAAVQTAAASQLGRMLITMADEAQFPLINIVRRDEQVELLKSMGAQHIFNSSHEHFAVELKSLCKTLEATIAFDAVAGGMTGTLINAMPRGSAVYVYGALSEEPCALIDPVEIVFNEKSIQGFYLGNWLRQQGVIGALRTAN